MGLLIAHLMESHFVYVICLQSWSSLRHQGYVTSYIAIRRHVNILLNRICIFWSLRSPYLIFLIADSDATSVSHPCWRKILLLFELMYEVLFSFANASYFALFLHSVEKRFFTALSVLHKKQWSIAIRLTVVKKIIIFCILTKKRMKFWLPAWNHLCYFCPPVTKYFLSLRR